eukprot:CAMPEP_0195072984 /NCGR_PEP_ID=MMETSP0448-20130528/16416_1 /TAXON_ID=66468 /ORGANISM="Heterocapsa triquestra, Strain CCMP 448" /LENGTH=42 /DNA_ID= /DNA_START= /DNA_END= /DNA_ORIENTATION=
MAAHARRNGGGGAPQRRGTRLGNRRVCNPSESEQVAKPAWEA